MDDLAKQVSDLVQRFPNPEDFIKEIEKTDKPDKEKGEYFFQMGDNLLKISNFKLALEVYNKALEYFVKFNNKAGQAKCYNKLGNTYIILGDNKKSIEYQEKALKIANDIDDKGVKGGCYTSLGNVYHRLGDNKKSIEYQEKALKIAKEIGDKQVESKCYVNLGNAYHRLGDNKKSIEYQEKALKIVKEIGDKQVESKCYGNLGIVYSNLGDFKKAIEYHEKALKIAKEIGDKRADAACCMNLGIIYNYLGDKKKSIEHHEKALKIAKEIGDKEAEAGCYTNLIIAYFGDNKKVVEYLNKSLKIFIEIGHKKGESKCYANLGYAYTSLGDNKKAVEYYEKSVKINKEISDKYGESKCYMSLGLIYKKLNDFKRSVEYYNKALEVLEKVRDIYAKNMCLQYMGEAYINKENFEQSEKYYKQAIEIIDNMRKENIPNEYKRNFWKDNISAFDKLIISDMKLGKREEAIEYSERGKGRTVYDYILGRGIEEKEFKPEPLKFKEIQELTKRIEKNLVLLRVTEKGTYAFIVHPSPFSSPTKGERKKEGTDGFELMEFLEFNTKRLEELTVKLEEGKVAGGWIHAYSNYKSVQENVHKLRAEKTNIEVGKAIKEAEGTWFKTMDDTLKILYDELMGKVFSRFDKGEKVVIIPNRALNILPLHACFYEEHPSPKPSPTRGEDKGEGEKRLKRHYLLEDYDISYAPNCNMLDLCHRREKERSKNNLFAIANPSPPYELAFSEWEVEEIAKLFDNKAVFSKQEAKDALVNNADSYGVIHLSSHGIYDLGSSFNSRLRLGKDSDLTLEEIFEKVRVNKSWLVCLSACESGLTDYRDIADEYIGLQTGFLCAGAPTVIASLWTINDFPTAFIMIKTYEYIFKQGLKKSEALRKAQLWLKDLTAEDALKLLKDKELELVSSVKMAVEDISPLKIVISSKDPKSKPFSHPYYWAGFQAIGA